MSANKIHIWADFTGRSYYWVIFNLKKQGHVSHIYIATTRFHHLILQKVCYKLGFVRAIINKIYGKKISYANPSFKEILDSISFPFRLLFSKNIIIAIQPYSLWVFYLLLLKTFGKNVVYYHSWPLWKKGKTPKKSVLYSDIAWDSFLKNLKTVALTDKALKSLRSKGADVTHITPSIDSGLFRPSNKKYNKITILYVGNIIKSKGIMDLVEAAKTYKNNKNIQFLFAGSGDKESYLKEKEKSLPIRYIGYINNQKKLAEIYRKSHIFVLPSHKIELFGRTLLEGMSSGLPVIGTEGSYLLAGPKEIIENGKNGYLIKEGDVKTLKNRIDKLIKNKNLREKMGMYGRKLVLEKYNSKYITKKWLDILKR